MSLPLILSIFTIIFEWSKTQKSKFLQLRIKRHKILQRLVQIANVWRLTITSSPQENCEEAIRWICHVVFIGVRQVKSLWRILWSMPDIAQLFEITRTNLFACGITLQDIDDAARWILCRKNPKYQSWYYQAKQMITDTYIQCSLIGRDCM